jgi:hypothetical protein
VISQFLAIYFDPEAVYEGKFKNGRHHGFGRVINENGNVYEGSWEYSLLNGQVSCLYNDGSRFEGEY